MFAYAVLICIFSVFGRGEKAEFNTNAGNVDIKCKK